MSDEGRPRRLYLVGVRCTTRRSIDRISYVALALFFLALKGFAQPSMSYLDNGVIRVGVDLNIGGVITYLSRSSDSNNVINRHDLGREVQQSYYSGPSPYGMSHPAFPNWPWNPIGAGDVYGHPSRVVNVTNDGTTLYVHTVPVQWALDNVVCECDFESWITLDQNAARIHYRLNNHRNDTTDYGAYSQELPAVYTIGRLHRLITYDGLEPFTGGQLSEPAAAPPPSWGSYSPSENWMALVDDAGWGLGVLNTSVFTFVAGFAGTPDVGGPADDPTGYIAPVRLEVLDHNIVYQHDVTLILGAVPQIRSYAIAHRRGDTRPDFHFDLGLPQGDRQGISYINASDRGLPFEGPLRIDASLGDPQIILPQGWWDAASLPVLYVTAAFHTQSDFVDIFWSTPTDGFAEARRMRFSIVPDGQMRTYAFSLAGAAAYAGIITDLRIDPGDGGTNGDYVDIASISFLPEGQTRQVHAIPRHHGTRVLDRP